MSDKLQELKNILYQVNDLDNAQALLDWDQQTQMPPGGAQDRGNQMSTLASLRHGIFTSRRTAELLEALEPSRVSMDPDDDDACLLRVTRRLYDKAAKVSPEWVAEFSKVTTLAHSAWEQAREKSDFAIFKPHLERVVALRREYSAFFAPYEHIYDPQLDDFEPGLKTRQVQAVFDILRPAQVELVQQIAGRPQVDDAFLRQHFPPEKQQEFGRQVITRFGYDWQRGRLDTSAHPFTTSFGLGDVRITTRFDPGYLPQALLGMFHECGHALYDQGYNPALRRTPLGGGASMAFHESQSRLWENLVGLSRPFWAHFLPRLQEIFPSQLAGVSLEAFYRGINRVEPSLIRVEADEATYNLHIMLRLELEIALIEGSLQVADLPEAWNSRMQAFLGLVPPDDARGVLQDIHWSGGSMGYFPTYALGNLVSAQLWECIHKDLPALEEDIRHGEFAGLLDWLRRNVHRHGAKFEPQDLLRRVSGSGIDPQPYLRYLQGKFGEIYRL